MWVARRSSASECVTSAGLARKLLCSPLYKKRCSSLAKFPQQQLVTEDVHCRTSDHSVDNDEPEFPKISSSLCLSLNTDRSTEFTFLLENERSYLRRVKTGIDVVRCFWDSSRKVNSLNDMRWKRSEEFPGNSFRGCVGPTCNTSCTARMSPDGTYYKIVFCKKPESTPSFLEWQESEGGSVEAQESNPSCYEWEETTTAGRSTAEANNECLHAGRVMNLSDTGCVHVCQDEGGRRNISIADQFDEDGVSISKIVHLPMLRCFRRKESLLETIPSIQFHRLKLINSTEHQTPCQALTEHHVACQGSTEHHVACQGSTEHHVACQGSTEHYVACQGSTEHHVACQGMTEHHDACQGSTEHHDACQGSTEHQVAYQCSTENHVACQGSTEHHVACQGFTEHHVACRSSTEHQVACQSMTEHHVACQKSSTEHQTACQGSTEHRVAFQCSTDVTEHQVACPSATTMTTTHIVLVAYEPFTVVRRLGSTGFSEPETRLRRLIRTINNAYRYI